MSLSKREKAIRQRLKDDFEHYAQKCLKIRTKEDGLQPLILNKAQKFIHEEAERQLAERGYVRIITCKGRQQGCSTYIGGRFYWKVSHQKGKRAYILTHEGEATANLFDMTARYHQHVPEIVKPSTDRDSGKELHFDGLDSGYKVGTAGAKETGRSQTIQYLHGCLSGDSLVILQDGSSIEMSDIKEGDLVVTSSGCVAPVKAKIYTGQKQTYTLSCWVSGEPIHATADHKILTIDGYKKLGDMSKDDWVAMPDTRTFDCMDSYYFSLKNKERPQGGGSKHIERHEFKLSEDFGYFLGYYLAEGHVRDSKGYITFCYHKDEKYIERALAAVDGLYTSATHKVVGNRGITTLYGKFLASAVNEICGRVKEKRIPQWFFNAPKPFLEGVLRGYLDGDGSKTQSDKIVAPSVHERIARQIQRIWWATYGACSVSKHSRYRYDVRSQDIYLTRASGNPLKRYRGIEEGSRQEKTRVVDGVVYCKVKSIVPRRVEPVYDIEVDHPDHNYQTSVGVVSNSEVAFWPNARTHARGVMQAVPKKSGEVFLESTSDGEGNYFYEVWRDAVMGKNDFVPVFIPWLWQDEYVSDVTNLIRSDDEKEYCEIAKEEYGLEVTDEQLQFRREKISELGGVEAFRREYPLTAEEAFSNAGVNQLLPVDKIRAALSTKLTSAPVGASILGVDVARYGDDRSVWTHRIGRYMKVLKVVEKATLTEVTGITKMILDSWDYQACFIDMGMGAGVVDMLHEMGYSMVEGVNFGGEPFNKDLYPNKRNEMFGEFIEWLNDEPVCIDVETQDEKDAIVMESAAIQYKFDSKSRKVMESKDDMKKRIGISNDVTDSMALTFTRPVVKYEESTYERPSGRHSKTGY